MLNLNKVKWIVGTPCAAVIFLNPANHFIEALVHHGYTEAGMIKISMPMPESDTPVETVEVTDIPSVAEAHQEEVSFDLSTPYIGQQIGSGIVTSDQGPRTRPCPSCSAYHNGVDWADSREGGEPLYAPGKVEVACKAQRNSSGALTGAGYYAEFQHQNMLWQLMHLQKDSCVAGGHEKGWVIGRVGTTGSSTGNHLHLSLRGPNREFLKVGTGHVAAVVVKPGE